MLSHRQNLRFDDVDIMLQATEILQTVQHRTGLSSILQPLWYRGLSDIQLNAVDSLRRALGDDILQGSMHRTYRKLAVLGIIPPPPKSGMQLLLRMSRGNDVAFLWFLMEMFYKTCFHEINYQLNEQIIMSAIFWLDLFPTLNELERLLPQPQKLVHMKHEKKHNKNGPGESQKRKLITKQSQAMPYFQKQIWPKLRHTRLSAERPRKQILLPTKPTIPGQSTLESRWFAAYRFRASERVARDVLTKEIDNLLMKLSDTDHKSMSQQHTRGEYLDDLKKFNMDRIRQERTRRKIRDQLQRLTDKYSSQLREMQTAGHSSKPVDPGFIYLDDVEDELICGIVDSTLGFHLADKSPSSNCRDHSPKKTTCTRQRFNVKNFDEPLSERDCLANGQRRKGHAVHVKTGTKKDQVQSIDSSKCQCNTEDSDFFKFGPTAFPYNFNFAKIFRQPQVGSIKDESLRLRAKFSKAFGEDIDFQNKVLNNETNGSLDYLVDRSAKRQLKESLKLLDEEHEKLIREETESEKLFKLESEPYDPDNIDLMKSMLRKALDHLAEDRRFVLPTLPDVHCVPLLLEWIRARYGKRYSHEEEQHKFFKDQFLMDKVTAMLHEVILRMPKRIRLRNKNLSNPPTFPAHTVNRERLSKVRDQHVKKFSIALMELGRIFYAAMTAHQSTPKSDRFHAYMPTRIRDLHITHSS